MTAKKKRPAKKAAEKPLTAHQRLLAGVEAGEPTDELRAVQRLLRSRVDPKVRVTGVMDAATERGIAFWRRRLGHGAGMTALSAEAHEKLVPGVNNR